jgi:hypothetical protein
VDAGDACGKGDIRCSPLGEAALLPGIEAAAGDAQRSAHDRDAVVAPLRVDEAVGHLDPPGLIVSRAKKAAAFRRISRSSRRIRTSRARRWW